MITFKALREGWLSRKCSFRSRRAERRSRPALAQLFLETPGELEFQVPRRDFLAARDRGLHLLLELVELLVAVGQDLHDRAADGLIVGLLDEVHVLLEPAHDDAREIQDSIPRDLHGFLPASSSSVRG